MQGWLMQHAAVAVALRCADGVNNFDIPFHEIYLPLPSILVFVSTNSVSRFHQIRYSSPPIQIPVFTNLVVPSHEFGFSLPPILTFLSTHVGKQKRHPFVGMSFSIAFPLSGGAWRIRTAVDGFADR